MKTIEQKTILLAEKAGLKYHKPSEQEIQSGSYYQHEPNYFHSLDAVAELEKLIVKEDKDNLRTRSRWFIHMQANTPMCGITATATQRADALGMAWGLWTMEECEQPE